MALVEIALRTHLAANAGVAAIVGTRIHPVRVPRVTLETDTGHKLTYRRASGGRSQQLDKSTGFPFAIFELTAWSRSYDTAKALADAVRLALDGFHNTVAGVTIHLIENIDEEDMFWEPEDGSDDGWFAIQLKYQIRYVETVTTFA